MNKNKLLVIAAAIILVLGIGGYLLSAKKSVNTTTNETTGEEVMGDTSNSAKSLRDLLGMSSQKCSFGDENGSDGTVYIGNGKMRGDFSITTDSQTMVSHMITDGKDGYVWIDGQSDGFKMSLDSETKAETSKDLNSELDFNKKANYSCGSWSVDSSYFDLPSSVKFTDMREMMKAVPSIAPKTGTSVKDQSSDQCSACDNVPESYKVQCRQSLGCN